VTHAHAHASSDTLSRVDSRLSARALRGVGTSLPFSHTYTSQRSSSAVSHDRGLERDSPHQQLRETFPAGREGPCTQRLQRPQEREPLTRPTEARPTNPFERGRRGRCGEEKSKAGGSKRPAQAPPLAGSATRPRTHSCTRPRKKLEEESLVSMCTAMVV